MAGASAGAIKAGSAYVSIFADASELGRGLKQIEGKIKRFGDGLANVGADVATIGAGIAGIGAAGLSALAWPLKLAANMENAEAAFTTLLKDEGKAKKLLGELEGFAASTPFQFDELADASKKLLAFGSAAGNVETELRSIGDIASAIGAPIGEITEIYGKARVQGRLFAEDINQLTGRGIPIIQELAKQFGVTEQEVKKLVESGQVNFGNLEKAFQSLTSGAGQFAGGMERQSKTLTGSFSTLKDNIVAAFRPFGKELLPAASKALQLASSAVQEFSKWAKQNAGLSVPLAAASIAMLGIGAAAAVAGFATVFLGTAISAVGTVAGGMAAAVALVGGSTVLLPIAAVTAGVLLVGAGIAYVIYQSGLLTPAIAFIGESFQRVFGVAKETIGGVTGALSSGEWGKAAQIAWTGIKLATLVGAQQVLKGIDALW
ncbi:MAG: phage tail tape measure protein, partial [Planctomycetales bacterium]|nr:phage tail tape measure protein [Planctomycetales bacterium]